MGRLKELLSKAFYPDDVCCIVCDGELTKDTRYGICDKCEMPYNTVYCPSCGRSNFGYCDDCKDAKFNFDNAYSPFIFEDNCVRLIHGFKYGNKVYLAKYLAEFLVDAYFEKKIDADFVTFVPMHKKKIKKRGYNQAELLAKEFSKIANTNFTKLLVRVKYSGNFARMNRAERIAEIKDSIALAENVSVKDKSVLLIDDVLTSGTTASECARVLKKAGATAVYVITFATSKVQPMLI